MEGSIKFENYDDVSYMEVSSVRSWDLIHSRIAGRKKVQPDDSKPGDELENLTAATELAIFKSKDVTNNKTTHYVVDSDGKKRIYLIEIIKNWSSIRGQMTDVNGRPVLMFICNSLSFLHCFNRTKVSVTSKRSQVLGSVIFTNDSASLLNANGHKILEIITRYYEGGVENVIVEIDSTRVGVISATSIKFTKYIGANEKALLVGAWIPIALHTAFTNIRKPKEIAKVKKLIHKKEDFIAEFNEADTEVQRNKHRHHRSKQKTKKSPAVADLKQI